MTKHLNNIVEQVHSYTKRVIKPMLGVQLYQSVDKTICGRVGEIECFLPELKVINELQGILS